MSTVSSKFYFDLKFKIPTFFPQISIALKTMTATTKDFAQTEHACVNQAGTAIWIAQVLGTIHLLRNQKGGWVDVAKCLRNH